MRKHDGELELDFGARGAVLVFGGPYSNLHALEALLLEAKRLGISVDRMICTGDIAGYCGDPLGTVQRIRASGVTVLMGNCEEQLGNHADNCGCGFSADMTCNVLSREWYAFAAGQLDEESRAWMRALPRKIRFRFADRAFLVVHGGVAQINQFIFASSPWVQKAAQLSTSGAEGILAGHCGIPFTQLAEGRLWHNAGVIGMPANDGQQATWYSILRAESGGIRIEHRRLHYAFDAAADRMRHMGLSHHYADALRSGLWPSLDVLPPQEAAQTGASLRLTDCFWHDAGSVPDQPARLALIAGQ
jgi:hypothetical protein